LRWVDNNSFLTLSEKGVKREGLPKLKSVFCTSNLFFLLDPGFGVQVTKVVHSLILIVCKKILYLGTEAINILKYPLFYDKKSLELEFLTQ